MSVPAAFYEIAERVSNRGRWGAEDQIGTLNFLTPGVVRRACAEVRQGRRFSLAMPLGPGSPQAGTVPGRFNPIRTMTQINEPLGGPDDFCNNDDIVVMPLQAATHWDALAHGSFQGRLYNGFDAAEVAADGAPRCGIDRVGSLTGRGVLLDIARLHGVDRLPRDHAIGPDDLDRAVERAGTELRSGDIILVRTGHIGFYHDGDRVGYGVPCAGLSVHAPEWFHRHEIAAVATDNLTFEVFPAEWSGAFLPVHVLHLVEMGLTQGQNFDLEALAADCAADGQYTFLLEASPQPFERAMGSPVNPVAIK